MRLHRPPNRDPIMGSLEDCLSTLDSKAYVQYKQSALHKAMTTLPAIGRVGYDRRRNQQQGTKRKSVKIISRAVPVKDGCNKSSNTICSLQRGVYIQVLEESSHDSVVWYKFACGWICTMDSTGFQCTQIVSDSEASRAWAAEYDNRRRISYAICAELIRSHSLTNARRVINSIVRIVTGEPQFKPLNYNVNLNSADDVSLGSSGTDNTSNGNNKDVCAIAAVGPSTDTVPVIRLTNLPDVSMEDLIVGLTASTGLRQKEILEFIKIAASQQSNPTKALIDIVKEVEMLMAMRPTLWLKNGYQILPTYDVKSRNDRFIMSAAKNDVREFESFLAKGIELAALHSELGYTAVHAAADFGAIDTLHKLISTGISLNVRDIRKGQTPLHFAAMSGRIEIIKLLLDGGCDRAILNYAGRKAYQVAEEQGNIPCRELLKLAPLPIVTALVNGATDHSISICWEAPHLDLNLYAPITEFMVEWLPVKGGSSGQGERYFVSLDKKEFTVSNLPPSTGHCFYIYSKSAAGWSLPSSKIQYFTLPAVPDAPPSPEVYRVMTNGMLFSVLDPPRDNGSVVNLWETEVLAYKNYEREYGSIATKLTASLDTFTLTAGSAISGDDAINATDSSLLSTESAAIVTTSVTTTTTTAKKRLSSTDMFHRFIKIKKIEKKYRAIVGLEPGSPYILRCRCRNESGWSVWGEWSKVITINPGVYVMDMNGLMGMVRIGWFKPLLAPLRRVTKYEVQFTLFNGPMTRTVVTLQDEDEKAIAAIRSGGDSAAQIPFKTLRNDITTNELEIQNLKPGNKYLCRVRCNIDNIWNEWDTALLSDVITMPATLPEAPFDVQPSISAEEEMLQKIRREREEAVILSNQLLHNQNKDREAMSTQTSTSDEVIYEEEPTDTEVMVDLTNVSENYYDVTHDTITINWTNGFNNGLPTIEYQIDMAKVRDYRSNDVLLSKKDNNTSEEALLIKKMKNITITNDTNAISTSSYSIDSEENEEYLNLDKLKELPWETISTDPSRGLLLSPQSFRAFNLLPGCCYVFRVRQRNQLGWSLFSNTSMLINTYPSLPPGRPDVVKVSAYHCIVQWKESIDKRISLTNLDYEVHVAILPSLFGQELGNMEHRRNIEVTDNLLESVDYDRKINSTVAWTRAEIRSLKDAHIDLDSFAKAKDGSAVTSDDITITGDSNTNKVTIILENNTEKADNSVIDVDDDGIKTIGVVVDRLASATVYVLRVRVRTVAGWSTWSAVSKVFTTLSTA